MTFLDFVQQRYTIRAEWVLATLSLDEISLDKMKREGWKISEEAESIVDRLIVGYRQMHFPAVVYRGVCVKRIEDINLQKLGTSWTPSFLSVGCYNKGAVKNITKIFVIKAEVEKNDVAWDLTLSANMEDELARYGNEDEMVLISGRHIKILEISAGTVGEAPRQDTSNPDDLEWIKVNKIGRV